jgi:hypothetical protein
MGKHDTRQGHDPTGGYIVGLIMVVLDGLYGYYGKWVIGLASLGALAGTIYLLYRNYAGTPSKTKFVVSAVLIVAELAFLGWVWHLQPNIQLASPSGSPAPGSINIGSQIGNENVNNTGSNNTFNIGISTPSTTLLTFEQHLLKQQKPGYPYALKITVHTNREMSPFKFGVVFSKGDVIDDKKIDNTVVGWGPDVSGGIELLGSTLTPSTAVRDSDGARFPAIQFSCTSTIPPFSPDVPLGIVVQSTKPLHVEYVIFEPSK